MNIEEAKKLKPGDRVLVEMEVFSDGHNQVIGKDGYVWLIRGFAKPENIREKIAPPRRRFKAGDVVYSFGKYWGLSQDEDNLGMVLMGCGSTQRHTHYSYVELICAAENREDRKEDA